MSSVLDEVNRIGRQFDKYVIQPQLDLVEYVANEIGEAIFGTPTITSVSISRSALLEDEEVDFTEKSILAQAIGKTTGTMGSNITEGNIYNYFTQLRNSTNYVKRSETLNQPTGTLATLDVDYDALENVLNGLSGTSVDIQNAFVSYIEANFYVLKYFDDSTTLTFDRLTGIVSGHDVTYPENGNLITQDLYLHSASFNFTSGTGKLRIIYWYYTDEENNLAEATYKDYTVSGITFENLYYQTIYNIPLEEPSTINDTYSVSDILAQKEAYELEFPDDEDASDTALIEWAMGADITALQLGYAIDWSETETVERAAELGLGDYSAETVYIVPQYFMYDVTDNTYPSLNVSEASYLSPFYPALAIRQSKVNLTESVNATRYDETTKALLKQGIKLSELQDTIDENEDSDKIWDTYVAQTIDVHQMGSYGRKYLFELFSDMQLISSATKSDWDTWRSTAGSNTTVGPPSNGMKLEDSTFNYALLWNYVETTTKTGSIADIDEVTATITVNSNFTYGGAEQADGTNKNTGTVNVSYITLRKQVTDNLYEEMVVHGLGGITNIEGKGNVVRYLTNDSDSYGLYLPMVYTIMDRFSIQDKVGIAYEGSSMLIYAVYEEKLYWYESPTFISLLQVGLIVLAVITMQPELIAAAASLTAFTLFVLKTLVYGYLIKLGTQYLIKEIGIENAIILAVILAVAAVATGQFTGLEGLVTLPTSEQLLMASTQLSSAISDVVKEDFSSISDTISSNYSDYEDTVEEYEDLWEEAYNGSESVLDVVLEENVINTNETLDVYLARTVHISNPGMLAVDAIHYFADMLKTIPDPPVPSDYT